MKAANRALIFTFAAAASLCVFLLSGCSSNGLTGGVAATVNGTEISEDKVTTYIQDFRKSDDLESEDAWGSWLAQNSLDPKTVREEVVDYYVSIELEKQAAAENNVSVADSDVDAVISSMKSNYDSDTAWQSALSSAGLTEDTYRDNVYMSMLEEKLQSAVITDAAAPTDDEVLTYVQQYASSYDGMKRSSQILFAAGDTATAQSVLDQINAGTLDFATAAKQYSIDTVSAANGGDVGWDALNSFVSAYTTALDGLSEGQVSGLVTSSYGIHIIKCTEVFTAPSEVTSLDQVPTALVDLIRNYVTEQNKSSAYSTWFSNYKSNADIQTTDMPSKVPYNLDITKYSSSSSDSTDDSADDSTDTATTATTTTSSSSSAA